MKRDSDKLVSKIESLSAVEILDSRGRPTLLASCRLADGSAATASVPSGASTGAAEALELRDGDPARYAGLGCLRAVANIKGEINRALAGRQFETQGALDQALLDLDGTPNKARLGANAILGVSLAFCRAQAAQRALPLYAHLAQLANTTPQLPRPMINLFSGGAHGGGQVAIQDVQLVVPAAGSIHRTLEVVSDVFRAAAALAAERYGARRLTADEGGLAPPFGSSDAMLSAAVEAIERAGYQPGSDVALTLDVAASQFYSDAGYRLDGALLTRADMIDRLEHWRTVYPIVSIEDGLHEADWSGWQQLAQRVRGRAMILGDDLLCTQTDRIQRAINLKAADSLLLKVNQIGTLTEALEALRLARGAGWQVVVSARSGETEDDWLADLAVGWSGDYIKVGSITQSERLAKYNRLLVLEAQDSL
ncbi:MAG: phosphopyruvate hydratase [Chloroflexi bacterium]|nr:phosphopyruvate hydratase [Chloroflexota bacterium]